MLYRRHFLKTSGIAAVSTIASCGGSSDVSGTGFGNTAAAAAPAGATNVGNWRMPDEAAPHLRTWMAFATSSAIWGGTLLGRVQTDLMLIANTISKYEPVSMLVQARDLARAQTLRAALPKRANEVTFVTGILDDLWMRDTSCVFVEDKTLPSKKAGVQFNFNGWGGKQTFNNDATVAAFVAQTSNTPLIKSQLVLEGGGIEVDGEGTAIIAESCVLNANRNPGITKAAFETIIKAQLGLDKIIWIPGISGKDITDGHTDFYARFGAPGTVLVGYDSDPTSYDRAVTLANKAALVAAATDARGRRLNIVTLTAPTTTRSNAIDFAAGYIGFYACNGAIIAQQFGDAAADLAAKNILQAAFPNRVIEQLNVDSIASGGGSVHCTTQQQPA
jgi:agmatine deiminase